jgi:hypothetical protein
VVLGCGVGFCRHEFRGDGRCRPRCGTGATDPNSNTDCNPDPNSNPDTDPNSNSNTDCNPDPNSNSNTDTQPRTFPADGHCGNEHQQ